MSDPTKTVTGTRAEFEEHVDRIARDALDARTKEFQAYELSLRNAANQQFELLKAAQVEERH